MGSPRAHSAQGVPIKGMGWGHWASRGGHDYGSIMPSYSDIGLYLDEKVQQDVRLTAPWPPQSIPACCALLPLDVAVLKRSHCKPPPSVSHRNYSEVGGILLWRHPRWKEPVDGSVETRPHSIKIDICHLAFLIVTILNLTLEHQHRAWGRNPCFSAKTPLNSVTFRHSTIKLLLLRWISVAHIYDKVNLVLSLEWTTTFCVVGKFTKYCILSVKINGAPWAWNTL